MLASAGIAPKNGWIADYPVTPDIIGELQNTIAEAADSGKLAMKKDEATKVFQDLIAQQGLPVRADKSYVSMQELNSHTLKRHPLKTILSITNHRQSTIITTIKARRL